MTALATAEGLPIWAQIVWMGAAITSVIGGAVVLVFFMLPIQREILKIARRGEARGEESEKDLRRIADALEDRVRPKRPRTPIDPARKP